MRVAAPTTQPEDYRSVVEWVKRDPNGMTYGSPGTAEELTRFSDAERGRWGKVIREAGIQFD